MWATALMAAGIALIAQFVFTGRISRLLVATVMTLIVVMAFT